MRSGNTRMVVATIVPVHKGEDIGRGLLRQILHDVDVNFDEFARLRRR